MAREPKFRGEIAYSTQPISGITVYQGQDSREEPSIEQMLEELEKDEIRGVRKAILLSKLKESLGAKREEKPSENPKRYLVDPGTGRIDVVDEDGEYTYKDALLVSASIKGKGGQYDEAINLIKAVKTVASEGQPPLAEKPKEFYVDPETGIIIRDPDNGEHTLSEARAISYSMRKDQPRTAQFIDEDGNVKEVPPGQPIVIKKEASPPVTYFVDDNGQLKQVKPGEPIVVKQRPSSPPGKTLVVRQTPEGMITEEYELGKPIIINAPASPGSNMPPIMPFPVMGSDGQPVYDKEGKPVYANIEPMMKWMGFQSDQKRADERHGALMGLVQAVRENLGDGVAAIKAAAEESKRGTGTGAKTSTQTSPPQQQAFKCGDCGMMFSPPSGWAGQPVKCPNPECGREYSKEELLGI